MKRDRPRTERVFERICSKIPGGVSSPARSFREVGLLPLIAGAGKGEILYEIDGGAYIDYCMSWGALPLGHAHPSVVEAVQKQMERGSSFGLTTELEEEMAFLLSSHLSSIEKVRFVSSGTEAAMSALRVARAYTGKSVFVKFTGNYHGHADPFLVRAGSGVGMLPEASSPGVPPETLSRTLSLPYNDVEAVKTLFASRRDIGAVIVEPIAANMGLVPGSEAFLRTLREETQRSGAVLIFDEVITGFRVGLQGAQGLFGIDPDLTCLGKIIGGGLPLAAFGGKREIMDLLAPLGGVYQAGTLSGNPLALAAGLAALREIGKPLFYETLAQKTDTLLAPFIERTQETREDLFVSKLGSLFTIFFGTKSVRSHLDLENLDKEMFKTFYRHLFERGIYFPPSQTEACFLSSAHGTDSIATTQEVLLSFCEEHLPAPAGSPG